MDAITCEQFNSKIFRQRPGDDDEEIYFRKFISKPKSISSPSPSSLLQYWFYAGLDFHWWSTDVDGGGGWLAEWDDQSFFD